MSKIELKWNNLQLELTKLRPSAEILKKYQRSSTFFVQFWKEKLRCARKPNLGLKLNEKQNTQKGKLSDERDDAGQAI